MQQLITQIKSNGVKASRTWPGILLKVFPSGYGEKKLQTNKQKLNEVKHKNRWLIQEETKAITPERQGKGD